MMTSTSSGGTIWPKWMLKPWANMRVAPALRFGATSFLYTTAWVSSGTSIMMTSACLVASAAVSELEAGLLGELAVGRALAAR